VAIAGRGLTSLPLPDFVVDPGEKPKPTKNNPNPQWPPAQYTSLPDQWHDDNVDKIPLSRIAGLVATLAATPCIWLPKTAGGHTRQYFPIHKSGMVKNSGSAVFDTFATVCKHEPIVFHWPNVDLDAQSVSDLNLILGRLTYFGRAESWCQAKLHTSQVRDVPNVIPQGDGRTHWECVCIEDTRKAVGNEYRDYTLERRLAACGDVKTEAVDLLPRTAISVKGSRPEAEADFRAILNAEQAELLLLRCLLRESGQDIKDGLERPIGTRWVHYAVPREIYDVPRLTLQPKLRNPETVDLVVYALNTATVHKPVLPALTDTLLVADRFRSAAMAVCGTPSRTLSGHEADDEPCQDHNHAFWWPRDEDNDGFIDHVTVYARAGFQQNEVDALRRLNRLRQRGGRPDLLVTPVFVGRAADYTPWQCNLSNTFISATPYFCPLHLSHGRTGGSRIRSVTNVIRQALHRQGIITDTDEVESIRELIFDYDPKMLPTPDFVNATDKAISPRQYIPVVDPTANPVPLAVRGSEDFPAYPGVCLRDPDQEHPFGLSAGIFVNEGSRFIRTLSFCRNRRGNQVRGHGRMLYIRFRDARLPQPFALGSQCHFGLGLFVCPTSNRSRPEI
jgi:CRISPR-associated protein Csb2